MRGAPRTFACAVLAPGSRSRVWEEQRKGGGTSVDVLVGSRDFKELRRRRAQSRPSSWSRIAPRHWAGFVGIERILVGSRGREFCRAC